MTFLTPLNFWKEENNVFVHVRLSVGIRSFKAKIVRRHHKFTQYLIILLVFDGCLYEHNNWLSYPSVNYSAWEANDSRVFQFS